MNFDIEEIKARLDIVDVISSYIKLEKSGVNYRARCPFHEEKTPSFFVSPSRQLWHCFGGCNEGGDIFKFVMKIEGVEFVDALKMLADKAGVQLKQNKEWKKIKSERQTLLEINNQASKFYEFQLEKSKKGQEAKDYLLKRGLKEETIKKWRLGYAPDAWQSLSDFLVSKGCAREDLIKAGLIVKKEEGKTFDRFRGRIMFPITGFNSEIIGFTGRIFDRSEKDEAKYLNTPATLLYDKSRALYGIDKARLEIRKKDFCVLVEGNVDCIMSHQAGVENCIAVSGTALTPLHLNIIKRYSNNLVLAFDMDSAGRKATERAIDLAEKAGFEIKVISQAQDKDPADIVLKEGEEKWRQMVKEAKPVAEFFFNLAVGGKNLDFVEDKKKTLKEFLPKIKKMENKVEQSFWVEKLASVLKSKEEDIWAELNKLKIQKDEIREEEVLTGKKTRREMLEEKVLALILKDRKRIVLISDFSLFSSPGKDVLEQIKKKENISFEELKKSLREAESFLNYLFLLSESLAEPEEEEELKKCLVELEALIKKEKQRELQSQIKDFEKRGEFDKVKMLLEEFKSLIKKDNYEEKEEK
ncbi:MAG TPA: DNA primase [Candidatus Pacearchaeota archaeon]|nr:DNA primase [Candidatus Pacearchaeota archaeon]